MWSVHSALILLTLAGVTSSATTPPPRSTEGYPEDDSGRFDSYESYTDTAGGYWDPTTPSSGYHDHVTNPTSGRDWVFWDTTTQSGYGRTSTSTEIPDSHDGHGSESFVDSKMGSYGNENSYEESESSFDYVDESGFVSTSYGSGQITDDLNVADVLETVGRAWNTGTFHESVRIGCDAIGNELNSLTRRYDIDLICEMFEPGVDIEGVCHRTWDTTLYYAGLDEFVGIDSISIIPNPYDCNRPWRGNDDDDAAALGSRGITIESLKKIYDHCSTSGARKINNIVFDLMDWLGPSVFNSYYIRRPEPTSLCTAFRFLLSMDTISFTREVIKILTFPMADFLEYARSLDICDDTQDELIRAARELLEVYSDLGDYGGFCSFISEEQSRETYLGVGKVIVRNVLVGTFIDADRCASAMAVIAPLDTEMILSRVTGYNLSVPEERQDFCSTIVYTLLTAGVSYEPSQFNITHTGHEASLQELFRSHAEILPDLFMELMRVYGAFLQADSIYDGAGIYCRVFKNLTSELVGEGFEMGRICSLIEEGELAFVEDRCLAFLLPKHWWVPFPLWLRPALHLMDDPIITALYLARRLSGIDDVNKVRMCSALEDRVDEVSLRGFMETVIDVLLVEGLPAISDICEHWEEFMCFHYTRDKDACESHDYHTDGTTPEPVRVTTDRYGLDEAGRQVYENVAATIWTAAGFESRGAFCDSLTGAIELSGRPNEAFVERTRGRIIGMLYEPHRCARAADALMTAINASAYIPIPTLYSLTGYHTYLSLCQYISEAFLATPSRTEAPVTVGTGFEGGNEVVANYNIFARISVYLKKPPPSVE